jgi:C4-dicarboxylate-specific signal transduction histidine kinase
VIIALSLIATLILIFIIRQRNEIARRNNLLLQRKNAAIEMQAKEILLQKEEIESTNESLKQTIQEVKTMQAQLVHSEKMSSLGQMTAGIAHEINNPLNFIAGSAQALKFSHDEFIREARQSTVLDQLWIEEMQIESDNLFDALDNGVYRVSKIVSSLKAFASPQQGRMVEASIREIIEMSLTLLNTQIRENNVDVVRNYDAVNSHVRLNTTQITQVFTNIMVNAIDAMRAIEKPQLVIATTETTEMVQTLIKDNGCGMPFEIQPRVLEPFFTTKQVGKGTGLGLSVSLGFIESHGGNLKFSSEPGKGTIFIVELPKSRDQSVFNDPH